MDRRKQSGDAKMVGDKQVAAVRFSVAAFAHGKFGDAGAVPQYVSGVNQKRLRPVVAAQ